MLQNGQTEPSEAWVTRRRTMVRREAKFVRSKKAKNIEKSNKKRFFNKRIKLDNCFTHRICILIAFLRSGLFLHPRLIIY